MILSTAAAIAIYNTAKELQSIGGLMHVRILLEKNTLSIVHVKEMLTDEINVWVGDAIGNPTESRLERYADWLEFARAYGFRP